MPRSAVKSVALHYQRNAARLARTYLDLSFEAVHAPLLSDLPQPGARIGDVGAGAGRDAYALAERGYKVVAIEPSAEMRRAGQASDVGERVDWINDALPALAQVRSTVRPFDFVLCSAVLMHIPPADLAEALDALRAVAAPGAFVAITLRLERSDDPPNVFYNYALATITAAAARANLDLVESGTNSDLLDRPDAVWTWCVFRAVKERLFVS